MAQQQPDQQKTFFTAMILAIILWPLLFFALSRFQGPPASGKSAETLLQEAHQLRQQKKYPEAVKRCQEVANRFKGTPFAAEALLLEAEVYGTDQDNFQQAVQLLRQMERFYPNTAVFQSQGRERLKEYGARLDQYNRQFTNYRIINAVVRFFGGNGWSYVAAIFVIALLARLVQLPIAHKQFLSMRKMQQLAPLVKEIQEKYKGEELARKQMELYRKYGVNPFSGCLYALIPFPFLIWVYNMIVLYQVQFQKGHFLWINPEMGQRYPGLVAAHLAQFDVILLGLYAISMYLSTRLSVMDPSQAHQQKMMALFSTVMLVIFTWLYSFPAAFILYWLLYNIFYTVHYQLYLRRPLAPLLVAEPSGNGPTRANPGAGTRYKPSFERKRSKRKTKRAK